MKKIFSTVSLIILGLAAATSCQDPLNEMTDGAAVAAAAGGNFEIRMSVSDIDITKTTAGDYSADDYKQGMKQAVEFSVGDRINLFHADYSAEGAYSGYGNDGAFTVTEVNDGVATLKGYISEDLLSDHYYDWFAIYPYNENNADPEHVKVTFPTSVKADEENPISALSESPLAGVAKKVKGGVAPNIKMNNIGSAVEIIVSNFTDDDITVNSIEISTYWDALCGSPLKGWCENIAGTYEFNTTTYKAYSSDYSIIAWDPDWLTYYIGKVGARYEKLSTIDIQKKIKVDVDDVVIEPYEKMSFFVPVAPTVFEIQGCNFAIKVNDLYKPVSMEPWKEYYFGTLANFRV